MGWFQKTFWSLALLGLTYVVGILSLTLTGVQRNATYAQNINPTWWQNLSDVESFGFVKHQVQPFTVTTPDNQTIYAWHILPIHIYKQHEASLTSHPQPITEDYSTASLKPNFQLLLSDPNAIAIISFHGNAGHLASSCRPATYQNLLSLSSPSRPVHVIAFDYRGFGLSSGTPTEEGVSIDSITLLSALTGHTLPPSITDLTNPTLQSLPTAPGIAPSNIILMGQSMGTFFATATYHAWTLQLGRPPFKALFLVASFTSLPRLLDSYSIKGISPPLLSPLMGYPRAQKWFLSMVVDKWDTLSRLKELVRAPDVELDLTIMHAKDDWEIPWREGRKNWEGVLDVVGVKEVYEDMVKNGEMSQESQVWAASGQGMKKCRWEQVERGGHNRVPTSERMKLNLLGVLDDA